MQVADLSTAITIRVTDAIRSLWVSASFLLCTEYIAITTGAQ
jgi:hypothetical protein